MIVSCEVKLKLTIIIFIKNYRLAHSQYCYLLQINNNLEEIYKYTLEEYMDKLKNYISKNKN